MRTDLRISSRASRLVQVDVTYDAQDGSLSQPTRIDWGDGTSTTLAADADGGVSGTHTYAKEGVYKVICRSNNASTEEIVDLSTFPAARDTSNRDDLLKRDLKQATATGRLG